MPHRTTDRTADLARSPRRLRLAYELRSAVLGHPRCFSRVEQVVTRHRIGARDQKEVRRAVEDALRHRWVAVAICWCTDIARPHSRLERT